MRQIQECSLVSKSLFIDLSFGFDVDSSGTSITVTSLPASVSAIKKEQVDDWAVIEFPQMHADWPILSLDDVPPMVGERLSAKGIAIV